MARKFLNSFADPLLTSVSMAASATGTPVVIQDMDNIGVQAVWTGSNPIGTLSVQVSADYNHNLQDAGTWVTLPVSMSPGGTPGNGYFDLTGLSAPNLRAVYTTSAGSSGALSVVIVGKGD